MAGKTRPSGTDPNTPLLRAAEVGDIAGVLAQLDAGVHPDNRPAYGYTPLHAALGGGHGAVVELLLNRGANPNAWCDPKPHYHARDIWLEAVQRAIGVRTVTPLQIAIANSGEQVVGLLLDHGADPTRGSAVHTAAAIGDEAVMRRLAAHPHVNVDTPLQGDPPLIYAIRRQPDALAIVRVLLDAGADPNAPSHRYGLLSWPLVTAFETRPYNRRVTELLLSRGADLHQANGVRPGGLIEQAAVAGNIAAAEHLIELGFPVNVYNREGETPLNLLLANADRATFSPCQKPVSASDLEAMVEFLLRNGAIATTAGRNGDTPLHHAVRAGLDRVVDMLVAAGASMDQPNHIGLRPNAYLDRGNLTTYHTPEEVRKIETWACEVRLSVSELVAYALKLLHGFDRDMTLLKSGYYTEPRWFLDGTAAPPGNGWYGKKVLAHFGRDFDPAALVTSFRQSKELNLETVIDGALLEETLRIERAGPERGRLANAREAYPHNLLATACLWLWMRDYPDLSDAVLAARALGVRQMVANNVIDRVQAYAAATILLQPEESDRTAGEAAAILTDMWRRAEAPGTAHADTLVPVVVRCLGSADAP